MINRNLLFGWKIHGENTKSSWITNSLARIRTELVLNTSQDCFFSTTNKFGLKILSELVNILIQQTPWPESAGELCRPRDRRLSAKLVPIFADRRCHVVSVTDPYGRNLGFLDR
jgi:hypothetical protein